MLSIGIAKAEFFDALVSAGLGDSHDQLERFLVNSIEGRELPSFSRNVSDSLELLAQYGESVGQTELSKSSSLGYFWTQIHEDR